MKKLALTTIGVAIVLIGFMAILYCLPCINGCHGDRDTCEMKDSSKCSGHHEGCKDGDGKCSEHHEGCEKGNGKTCPMEQGGCKMEGMENGGCKMEGMEKEGCEMQSGGSSCSMENGNQCCCCCKMMMMMMNGCKMKCDSMKKDSVHLKIRGKM